MVESSSFCFDSVHWLYEPDNSISLDRNIRKMQKRGLQEVTVKCKSCEHLWLAMSSGPGQFIERAGGNLTFTCPQCKISEHNILLSDLE